MDEQIEQQPSEQQPRQPTTTKARPFLDHDHPCETLSAEQYAERMIAEREQAEQAQANSAEHTEGESEEAQGEGQGDEPQGDEEQGQQAKADRLKELAAKFKLSREDLANPKIKALLVSQMEQESEDTEADETEDGEEGQEDAQGQPQLTPEQQAQQHYEMLQQVASHPSVNDPAMVAAFRSTLGEVFGAGDDPVKMQNVNRLSDALVMGGTSLAMSLVPQLMDAHLEAALERHLPGLSQMHSEGLISSTWERVRASDPAYKALPQFGTPEFKAAAEKVYRENPWLDTLEFRDRSGRQLPIREALRMKATTVAKLLSGERLSPEIVKQAAKQGAAQATATARKVSAARLSGGRSKGAFEPATNRDDGGMSIVNAYKERHGGF